MSAARQRRPVLAASLSTRRRRGALASAMVVLMSTTAAPRPAAAWGIVAHRWIALRAATLTRCRPLVAGHEAGIAEMAIEPDTVLKPQLGRPEEVRHFLDLDAYGAPPFSALPRDEEAALRRYGPEALARHGVLPWHASRVAHELADEIARGEWRRARRTAAYLAHYGGDATMPLHATENYDGERTRQRGIHRRIEAQLVDEHLAAFTRDALAVRSRQPIAPDRSAAALFAALEESFAGVAPLLAADRAARRGTRVGSALYYRRLDADLHPLLSARLGAAAALTAALWDGACGRR